MGYRFFGDTFTNFLSGLGMPGRDKLTGHRYTKALWTRDQLEAAYQSDWIARKAIQIPAQDATREWRAWQAEQDQIELIEETEDRLHVQLKLQDAMIKARLYGGSCILIGVDGDMAAELDPETIGKDGLKFLHIFAPHQLVIQELVRDIASPYYGQPEFYTLHDDTGKIGSVNIHPSRMVRLIGLDPPDPMINYGWGDPLMQTINDAVAAAGNVCQSIASMISEAKFDVIKIPGLTEIFATDDGTSRLIKRFSEANVAKSVINAVVLDGEEEWQRVGVNFAGMPEIMQMYMQIAAGAVDIPVTRFLGMSPAGLNSTGESDLQNYYDRIHSDQELRLTPALEKLDIAIQRSALGKYDENIFYEWNSLWQTSETEKAAIAKTKAETATADANAGLIPFEALVKGRCNQLIEDGTYPGLEAAIEEAIKNAELMNEEELATQMAMEHQQQKLLPAPGERGMEGQTDEEVNTKDPKKKKKKEAAPVSDSRTFHISVNGHAFTFDELEAEGVLDNAVKAGLITYDAMREWNEAKHSRVEGGKEAGQFGSGSGTPSEKAAAKGKRATQAVAKKPDMSVGAVLKRARAAGRTLAEQHEFEIAQGMAPARDPSAHVLTEKESRQRNLERQQAINARHLTAQGQQEAAAAAEKAKAEEEAAHIEAVTPKKKGEKVVTTKDDWTASGIKISEAFSGSEAGMTEFLSKWNTKIGMHPTEFKRMFTGGMQDRIDMSITLSGPEFHVSGQIFDRPIGTGAGPRPKFIGTFDRHIKPDKKEAYSAYFKIDKAETGDKEKADHIGKYILGGNVDFYESQGITTVKVSANIDVGGYAWAKYGYVPTQAAWSTLRTDLQDKLDRGLGGSGTRGGDTYEADDWSMLSEDQQERTKYNWMRDSRSEFIDQEESSWRDSGQPLEDAKKQVAEEFKDKSIPPAWVSEAIGKARERMKLDSQNRTSATRTEPDIPFADSEIYAAMLMEDYESRNGDGSDDFEFSWDDDILNEPPLGEKQKQLPGMEQDRSEQMTDRMRKYVEIEMGKAADIYASDLEGDIEAPDYLSDQVEEYMEEYWDGMDDGDRLRLAITYGHADIEDEPDEDEDVDVDEEDPELTAVRKALNEKNNPKALWKVSDTKLGKKLLLNSGWSGVLDLGDEESYARFKKYVSKRKK